MTAKHIISALALVSAMGLSVSASAQDHTINGAPVPADQMQAVQDKCDELNAAGGGAAAGAEAPAAGADAGAAGAAGADAGAAGAAAGGDAGAAAGAAAQIDVETLTLEMCQTGGFVTQ